MIKKLTLTIDERVISQAKSYAQRKQISLSKMVESYFLSFGRPDTERHELPAITNELKGMIKHAGNIDDKQILTEALTEKFL